MPEIYDVEEAYLGGLLIDPDFILSNPVAVKDFHIHRNRFIYKAIQQVYQESGSLDYVLLSEQLKRNGHYEEVGGDAAVMKLMNATPTALHTPQYASEIRKKAQTREFMQIANELAKSVANEEIDPIYFIERMQKAIRVEGQTETLNNIAQEYSEYVQQRQDNPTAVWGIPTPWDGFNKVTGGLQKGEALMVYGDSGLGKTTLVLQMGFHAAAFEYKVDFYELEMTRKNLFGRLVAMKSGVPTRKIHAGQLRKDPTARRKVDDAINYVQGLPIRISDSTHWTSSEIRADQQKKGRDKADIVVVDYLALLQDDADNDYVKVERAAKNLRQMAKDLNQCLLTVASDVKDGSIKGTKEVKFAQDEIWHLKRESESIIDRVRKLTPTKRRNDGELGFIELVMEPGLPRFKEFS